MKAKLGIVCSVAILAAFLFGCAAPAGSSVPPLHPPTASPVQIEVSCDEFGAQKHITKDVEVTLPASLIVSLCANPTTGFQWGENAQISDNSVMSQYEHNYVAPQGEEPLVGAPGKDVWTFKSLKKGTTTITMEYSRPWEGGEKGEWTYTLNVIVK